MPNDAAYANKITDVSDLVDATNRVIKTFNADSAYWRGHAKANWSLIPRVFRLRAEGEPPYYESALIGHFVSRAPSRSHGSHPSPGEYLEWLFLAQHYGLPTRLLDWSDSPLVAAYFAVTEPPHGKDGCLWALRPGGLNQHFGAADALVQMRDLNVVNIAECAFDPDKGCDRAILALDGREIDRRMLAQLGRFTIHAYPAPIDLIPGSAKWLRKFVIPTAAKSKIKSQLAALGIRRSNMFPDLENLAGELRDQRFV